MPLPPTTRRGRAYARPARLIRERHLKGQELGTEALQPFGVDVCNPAQCRWDMPNSSQTHLPTPRAPPLGGLSARSSTSLRCQPQRAPQTACAHTGKAGPGQHSASTGESHREPPQKQALCGRWMHRRAAREAAPQRQAAHAPTWVQLMMRLSCGFFWHSEQWQITRCSRMIMVPFTPWHMISTCGQIGWGKSGGPAARVAAVGRGQRQKQ